MGYEKAAIGNLFSELLQASEVNGDTGPAIGAGVRQEVMNVLMAQLLK